jgi:hypothetical protein
MLIQYYCGAFEKCQWARENVASDNPHNERSAVARDVDGEMYVRAYVLTFFGAR